MQTRQFVVAALLGLTAFAAMSQELDPRNDRTPDHPAGPVQSVRTRESVIAETRNLQAEGKLSVVGEKSEAPVVGDSAVKGSPDAAVPAGQLTRAQVKAELAAWRATHRMPVGDQG